MAIGAGFSIIALLAVTYFLAIFTNSFLTCSQTTNGVTIKTPCNAGSMFGSSLISIILYSLIFIIVAAIPVAMAYLAFRAGSTVQVKPNGAGIRMIIYSCLVLILAYSTTLAVIPGVLLLLGGIFAIVGANIPTPAPIGQGSNNPGLNSASSSSSTQTSFNQPLISPVAVAVAVNPFYNQAFNEAVAMSQAGNKTEAYFQLKKLQKEKPDDVNLLLWLAFTTTDLGEARSLIGMAKFMEPESTSVKQAQEWLDQELARVRKSTDGFGEG